MYKIICGSNVIDVVRHPSFIRFLTSGHITMTDKSSAQGLLGADMKTVYVFKAIPGTNYKTVTIKEISLEEFERLKGLLNSGEVISADDRALAEAKELKLKTLSNICKARITAGFKVQLSTGEQNFKLTLEDQVNLMQFENLLLAGEQTFIYHATDEPCKIYSREDITKILKAYRAHILYHTTYFNLTKQFLKSLNDIEKVNTFNYGDDITGSVEDPVLKAIVRGADVN